MHNFVACGSLARAEFDLMLDGISAPKPARLWLESLVLKLLSTGKDVHFRFMPKTGNGFDDYERAITRWSDSADAPSQVHCRFPEAEYERETLFALIHETGHAIQGRLDFEERDSRRPARERDAWERGLSWFTSKHDVDDRFRAAIQERADYAVAKYEALVPRADLVVDTNVVIEMFTMRDLEKDLAWFTQSPTVEDLARPELRHRLESAVGSFVLLHHLAVKDLVTVMVHSECIDKLKTYAAPGTDTALWAGMLIVDLIGPVLRAINNAKATEQLRKTKGRDEFDEYTREEALRRGIPLVTRDRQSTKLARRMGVDVQTPEEYLSAAGVASTIDAVPQALEWYEGRVQAFLAEKPQHDTGHIPQRLMDPARALRLLGKILAA